MSEKYILFLAPEGSTLDHGGLTLETTDGTEHIYDVAVPFSNAKSRQSAIDTYCGLRSCEIVCDGLPKDHIARWPSQKKQAEQPTQRYHRPTGHRASPRPIMS